MVCATVVRQKAILNGTPGVTRTPDTRFRNPLIIISKRISYAPFLPNYIVKRGVTANIYHHLSPKMCDGCAAFCASLARLKWSGCHE